MSTQCLPVQNWIMVTGKKEKAAVSGRETGLLCWGRGRKDRQRRAAGEGTDRPKEGSLSLVKSRLCP